MDPGFALLAGLLALAFVLSRSTSEPEASRNQRLSASKRLELTERHGPEKAKEMIELAEGASPVSSESLGFQALETANRAMEFAQAAIGSITEFASKASLELAWKDLYLKVTQATRDPALTQGDTPPELEAEMILDDLEEDSLVHHLQGGGAGPQTGEASNEDPQAEPSEGPISSEHGKINLWTWNQDALGIWAAEALGRLTSFDDRRHLIAVVLYSSRLIEFRRTVESMLRNDSSAWPLRKIFRAFVLTPDEQPFSLDLDDLMKLLDKEDESVELIKCGMAVAALRQFYTSNRNLSLLSMDGRDDRIFMRWTSESLWPHSRRVALVQRVESEPGNESEAARHADPDAKDGTPRDR